MEQDLKAERKEALKRLDAISNNPTKETDKAIINDYFDLREEDDAKRQALVHYRKLLVGKGILDKQKRPTKKKA